MDPGRELGLPSLGEGPKPGPPLSDKSPKLGSDERRGAKLRLPQASTQGPLTPTQPQLRLEQEQLSFLNGKGKCPGADWGVVVPVTHLWGRLLFVFGC